MIKNVLKYIFHSTVKNQNLEIINAEISFILNKLIIPVNSSYLGQSFNITSLIIHFYSEYTFLKFPINPLNQHTLYIKIAIICKYTEIHNMVVFQSVT